jgi:hypothetical protein
VCVCLCIHFCEYIKYSVCVCVCVCSRWGELVCVVVGVSIELRMNVPSCNCQ